MKKQNKATTQQEVEKLKILLDQKNRELEIEAALERVRSRSMAMHKSEELREVVDVIFSQLELLGFNLRHCLIGLSNKKLKESEVWYSTANKAGYPNSLFIPKLDHPYHDHYWNAFTKGKDFAVYKLAGKSKENFLKLFFEKSDFKSISNEGKKYILSIDKFYFCHAFMAYGAIEITEQEPPTEENISILKRFAKVFEQTYTRFLDLQKAEAQAREAQIETALEKVRSRSLAMHKSDELQMVVNALEEKFKGLEMEMDPTDSVSIGVYKKGSKDFEYWIAGPYQTRTSGYRMPYGENPIMKDLLVARESDASSLCRVFSFEEKNESFNYFFDHTDLKHIPENRKKFILAAEACSATIAFSKHSWIQIVSYSEKTFNNETLEKIKRFAKVFNQAYIRFLDLQKAEAQAREAQIEAALEKVRSRSLAMHKSEQLPETAKVLFEQFELLGEVPDRIGICIINEEIKEFDIWLTDQIGSQLNHRFKGAFEEATVWAKMYKAWKEGKDSNVIDLSGQDLKDWVKYVRENVKLPVDDTQIKDRRVHQAAFFSQGMILFTSNDPVGDETMRLLVRFTKVFDQAYIRFLDLQKAEAQAREAQIEAALEKVRSRSLAMHKSDELQEVINSVYDRFIELGIKVDAVNFIIFIEGSKDFINWTGVGGGFYKQSFRLPYLDFGVSKDMWNAIESGKTFFYLHYSFEEKNTFWQKLFELSDLKHAPEERKKFILEAEGWVTALALEKFSGIQLNRYSNELFSEEDHEVQKRFAKVFEQTYIRFLDLQKAEAQAREAQIENALEKVRSRSLAMHNTDELQEVITTVLERLNELGLAIDTATVCLPSGERKELVIWIASKDYSYSESFSIPFGLKSVIAKEIENVYPTENLYFAKTYSKEEKDAYYIDLFEHSDFKQLPQARKDFLLSVDQYGISAAVNKNSGIYTISYSGKILNEVETDVLKRFSLVFDQAYIRFLDLQKAEAQAREAQIEAALERVRSGMMAMHHSDGLPEVMKVIAEQLIHLGVRIETVSFIPVRDEKDWTLWIASTEQMYPNKIFTPYLDHPIFNSLIDAVKNGNDFVSFTLSKKDKNRWWRHFFEKSNVGQLISNKRKEYLLKSRSYSVSTALGKNSVLSIMNYAGFEFSDEENEILKRFGKVFEQSYTRFLDLQKAEEQAHEAQIEAALEKVRSRSLAMHKSDELQEVITTVLHRLNELGLTMDSAFVGLPSKEKNTWITWIATNDYKYSQGFKIPFGLKTVISNDIENVYHSENVYFSKKYSKEEKDAFYVELFEHTDFKSISQARKDFLFSSDDYGISIARSKISLIEVLSYSGKILNKEEAEVLKRFSHVFEQAYIRFLDLQKAEAQAREAQIEAALERVRAQSMAMHKSDELSEVASVLYKEFINLGISEFVTCGFNIYNEKHGIQRAWITQSDGSLLEGFALPLDADDVFKDRYQAWKQKDPLFHQRISGTTRKHHIGLAIDESDSKTANEMAANFPDPLIFYNANFTQGYLSVISGVPLSLESQAILVRFAKVFEQTYTRFLDLQKAEAQAREAQIEASLERVRARSMAMHKSEELQDVINQLYTEIESLGVHMGSSMIVTDLDEDITKGQNTWMQNNEQLYAQKVYLPYLDHPVFHNFYSAWSNKTPFYTVVFTKKEKNLLFRHFFKHSPQLKAIPEERKKYLLDGSGLTRSVVIYKNAAFIIQKYDDIPFKEEEINIQKRFGSVFEQTYTRFLDLQKAEAQAREAQIEAALEKVRSRSLAMHKSEELQEVVNTVFEMIESLGTKMDNAGILIFGEVRQVFEFYMASISPSSKKAISSKVTFPYFDHPMSMDVITAKEKGKDLLVKQYSFKMKNEWFKYMFEHSDFKRLPEKRKSEILAYPSYSSSIALTNNSGLQLANHSDRTFSKNEHENLMRFAKVFEQAYTRFLDLQKAEVQAREAQIEYAMEIVRSRTMAMQKSDELAEIAVLLFQQIKSLGVSAWGSGFNIWKKEEKVCTSWMAAGDGNMRNSMQIPMTEDPTWIKFRESRLKEEEFWVKEVGGEELEEHYRYFQTILAGNEIDKIVESGFPLPKFQINHVANFAHGNLMFITFEPVPEAHDIFKRFAKVFEQTYTRFLDLQKAEAQAREAQIEASLERVRARSMAMHKSEELQNVINQLVIEIESLGVHMGSSMIVTDMDEDITKGQNTWLQNNEQQYAQKMYIPYLDHPMFHNFYKAWSNKKPFYTEIFTKKEKNRLFRHFFKHSPQIQNVPEERKKYVLDGSGLTRSVLIYKNAAFIIQKYDDIPFKEEEINIQKRFGSVFEQTYTRFLDLQKAEAQAKEAQIETALERVRSRTMAMHNSDELEETSSILFQQLEELGIEPWRCGIAILDQKQENFEVWSATTSHDTKNVSSVGYIKIKGHKILRDIFNAWKRQDPFLMYDISGEKLKNYLQYIGSNIHLPEMDATDEQLPTQLVYYHIPFAHGTIYGTFLQPIQESQVTLIQRFAKVFEQTYTRYLDLQKAEAQAREAQIEAALERVRSKTMAMHNSHDVGVTVVTLFHEVLKLGLDKSIRCGIGILEGREQCETWSATSSPNGKDDLKMGKVNMTIHPMLVEVKKAWKSKKKEYSYEFIGKDVTTYYKALNDEPEYPFEVDLETLPEKVINYSFFFSSGILFAFTENPISEEAAKVLYRFASVFGQTYRRYLDLQKAEAQAKEAIKQTSLDRVRGEIASMRSKNDLERITPLIWQELTALGVPFIRCGVFIMDEENKIIQSHLSSPDGESLGVYGLPYEATEIAINLVHRWRNKKAYKEHWDKDQFLKFIETMAKRGFIQNQKVYQGASSPPESLDLHFVPFEQGMLYVGNAEPLMEEEMSLVQSLAETFSIAYARYEDFTQLEQAKNQIEQALGEVKSTQTQLIHSEKMASLGELTAGIAHEIQNPLNFVNNFSEVSADLLHELKEELAEGNSDEVEEISKDLIQNLEKIHHHGQRASSIVKGMLEHSRTGTKEKELTDINMLADEYLRLSYHGLRAKDKSFNADFKTDLDEKLPKVKVISQDIGRVLLNMINNAFYAVSSKAKSSGNENYIPEIVVSTKLNDKKVEIVVQDNGDGIPQKNVDKIFQPFFTTKPTGQGTGLGLSLSYDIITQGHDGHLEVETEEGIGTRFIIEIPLTL